jgi:broad specificity phosphatase PhoE
MVNGSYRQFLEILLAGLTATVLFILTALPAAAMTVTFVRHGESEGNASGILDTSVPGPHITALGAAQAQAVAGALAADGTPYDAIYTSNMVRTNETAAPFAAATGLTPVALPGFREINAGFFEGSSEDSGPGRIGYVLSPALWTLGARSVPIAGGGDGNAFDARVDGALKVIEESGAQNPVVFSHGATIMFWTMMNVDNPDLGLMLRHRLDNTEVVVVEGSTEDGWTLKSWAGRPVGPATLGTKLFVDVRDLVVSPQTAAYNVVRAFGTRDIGRIADAIRDGVGAVVAAPVKFTAAVVRDVVDEVSQAIRPQSAHRVTTDDVAAPASARIAPPEAAEPEQPTETKKPRTTRTAKKPARSTTIGTSETAAVDVADRTEDTDNKADADNNVTPIAPDRTDDSDSTPSDDKSGEDGSDAEKAAA